MFPNDSLAVQHFITTKGVDKLRGTNSVILVFCFPFNILCRDKKKLFYNLKETNSKTKRKNLLPTLSFRRYSSIYLLSLEGSGEGGGINTVRECVSLRFHWPDSIIHSPNTHSLSPRPQRAYLCTLLPERKHKEE